MRRLAFPELLATTARAWSMAPTGLLIDSAWLEQREARVIAQPSGTAVEDEILSKYLDEVGRQEVLVVALEPTVSEGYASAPHEMEDLQAAFSALFGLSFCVMPSQADVPAILVTTADYRLIVGPVPSLGRLLGSLEDARDEYLDWCDDPSPRMGQLLAEAGAQMSWLKERKQ